ASAVYNFVHRVKSKQDDSYKWYFASAKLLYEQGKTVSDKILVAVNEVNAAGTIAHKINRVLDEGEWMKRNFAKFCRLSKREKQLLGMFAFGKTNTDIAEMLGLTILTVNTHRRNIKAKLGIKTFTEMYRFAVAFRGNAFNDCI
ncbi:MAG: helix-turn-helix transcriptional regulator, partial [Ferruginibacter sp.]|nr:helix-turn-helix transcriptional regulator [Ferruginibacter sp.]